VLAGVALVVVIAIAVVTWLAIDDRGATTTPTVAPTTTIPGQIVAATAAGAPVRGDAAPDFTLPTVDGKGTVSLSGLRGTPVVLNFWASWCTPCRAEFPILRQAAGDAQGRYQVIGVNTRDHVRGDARSFLTDEHTTWPNGYDADESVRRAYGVNSQPQTVFIDADGVVVARVAGQLTRQTLDEHLRELTR
jgi:peroxiredoxin